jgi:hypothetical protein
MLHCYGLWFVGGAPVSKTECARDLTAPGGISPKSLLSDGCVEEGVDRSDRIVLRELDAALDRDRTHLPCRPRPLGSLLKGILPPPARSDSARAPQS